MILRIISVLVFCLSTLALADEGPVQLADDAPDSHVVVKGDTLWGISGRFLKHPWRWPEVWRLNREQIRNPHLIYPGQVVFLDRSGPYLRLGRRVGGGTQDSARPSEGRASPRIYDEKVGSAIPSIPYRDIEPFLSRPLVVDESGLKDAGMILATQENRVMVGAGNVIYATKVNEQVRDWQIFRPEDPIRDPISNEVLGHEAFYLGTARLARSGEPATLEVTRAVQEVGRGDKIIPTAEPELLTYAPHAPESQVSGHVIRLYDGVGEVGRNQIVTLNLGKRQGMEVGHVLALYRNGELVPVKAGNDKATLKLPDERYGLAFVFRVFDRVSYALIMNSERPVKMLDVVRTP